MFDEEETTLDSLAGGAQAVLVDTEIEDRGTGVAYTAGAVVSFRLWVDVKPEAVIEAYPRLHVLVVPAGEGIPSLTSESSLKQSEHFHWAMIKLSLFGSVIDASTHLSSFLEIKTARRYRQGDRFVVVLVNMDSSIAFGAAAIGSVLIDAYVRPD